MSGRTLLIALPLLVACGPGEEERKNIVLIVVDSLRADRLSLFGHGRPVPGIDALAREGTSFERAYATAPWTKPSVASMLTGLHPTSHGVTNTRAVLDESVLTLPEILEDAGYATAGVVSHHFVGKKFRFHQGFDEWDQETARGHRYISSQEVTKKSVAFLRSVADRPGPFFLFAHYFDPHYDYRDHPGIDYAAATAGRLDGSRGIGALRKMVSDMTEAERGFLLDRYDEEILFTDAMIARLLTRLERLGLADETIVAFTVDHGEEFGERGWLGHMRTLYEELMHVPLVLRGPGVPSAHTIEHPVSLVDLAPTLLELAGVDPSGRGFEGRSLVPLLSGLAPPPAHVFLEVDYEGAEEGAPGLATTRKKAVVAGSFKLIRDDRTGAIELYDLENDPDERTDLVSRDPSRAAELSSVLERHLAELTAGARIAEERSFTDEELDDLRELGYVGDE